MAARILSLGRALREFFSVYDRYCGYSFRDQSLGAVGRLRREHFRFRDGDRASWPQDGGLAIEQRTDGGAQEVDLEFEGEGDFSVAHRRGSGGPSRMVSQGRHDASVSKTILLTLLWRQRELRFHLATR